MKKIEILFPEVTNLYGDLENIKYLKESQESSIEIIETSLNQEPLFVRECPDLIFMGTMTEEAQELVINRLEKYKERLIELIDSGVLFLITGNAVEIFGESIIDISSIDLNVCKEKNIKGLNIFNFRTEKNMLERYNSLYIGKFEKFNQNIEIVGYKSVFSFSFAESRPNYEPLIVTERGIGINKETKEEGVCKNNFMATYITGPLLILNPYFAKFILSKMGLEDCSLMYEKEAIDAYESRLIEYKEPERGFVY